MRESEKIYDALSQTDDDMISECEKKYASAKSKNSKISKAPLIKDQERLNGIEKLFFCRKSQENFSCTHS